VRPALTAMFAMLWLMAASGTLAQTRDYRIDPEHSRVLFRVEHLGLSHSIGTFAGLSGSFRFDEDYWNSARVEATIALDSLELGDDDWQQKVLEDYLHADRH